MMSLPDNYLAYLCLAFLTILLGRKNLKIRPPLPPGPKRLPLIGNLFNLPGSKDRAWEVYAEWEKYYGGIISMTVLGYNFIVLNDLDIAIELLEKRGNNYADRPVFPLFVISGLQRFITLMPYGPRLRENRKLMSQVIGSTQAVKKFYPLEESQATMLIRRVLADPDALEQVVKKTASAMILQISYGYTINEDGRDEFVGLADDALNTYLGMSNPTHFLINLFPLLGKLPSWVQVGIGYKQFVNRCKASIDKLMDRPYLYVREEMAKDTHAPSYLSELLSNGDIDDEEAINNMRWSAASLYGGVDTTIATTYSYFLAVTAYPEVQEKLQREIDSVIGRDRLPTFEDRPSLPYAEAVCREVLRWMPVGPLGIPHRTLHDDVYKGYLIPKGSIVCANIWKFLHDPKRYKDPSSFNPDRFLGPNPERDPSDFCYGFGRRVCPGSKLGDATAWINVVKSGAALSVTKARDEHGQIIEPVCEQISRALSHPRPFKCSIKPRYKEVLELVENAVRP